VILVAYVAMLPQLQYVSLSGQLLLQPLSAGSLSMKKLTLRPWRLITPGDVEFLFYLLQSFPSNVVSKLCFASPSSRLSSLLTPIVSRCASAVGPPDQLRNSPSHCFS